MSNMAFESAHALAARIRNREIGCLELLEHYITRADRYDGALNALIVRDDDRARTRAREADAALGRGEVWGPLHGVPMTIKESYDIAGLPTTWGLEALRDNIAETNSVVVDRMLAAGVTLYAKSNVPVLLADWQSYNPIYGSTSNPWDTGRTPGGSSGGGAAALASGMTALESGSDIGASIRNPAHYCGVFGHKPTWGIVPPRGHATPGVIAPADISVVGPLARSAEDLEIALDAMAGPYGLDANCWRLELPPSAKTEAKEFKVAVMLSDPNCAQDDAMTEILEAAVTTLARAGVQVNDTARPAIDTAEAHRVYVQLLRSATSARQSDAEMAHQRAILADADPDDESYVVAAARGNTLSHRDWIHLNEKRSHMREAWGAFFEDFDLLLCPVAASTAFPHDQQGERHKRTILINNVPVPVTHQLFWAGYSGAVLLPSSVAPAGFSQGLPCGLQIVAAHGHDKTALAFAKLMEREVGGFVPPPGYDG